MSHAAALPENIDIFIKYNINWVWSDVLKTYQTASKFSRVNLMSSMFHVKHNINDNPSITLEKLMKIRRQLEVHKYIVDEIAKIDEPVAIANLPDHPTPWKLKTHTRDAVPFLIWYPGIQPDEVLHYDEFSAKKGSYGVLESQQFMQEFLQIKQILVK